QTCPPSWFRLGPMAHRKLSLNYDQKTAVPESAKGPRPMDSPEQQVAGCVLKVSPVAVMPVMRIASPETIGLKILFSIFSCCSLLFKLSISRILVLFPRL